MQNNLINISKLVKNYKEFSLKEVDLIVPAGSIVGFVGENGSGKTTTIKCLLGLVRPQGGSVKLFGEEVSVIRADFVGQKRFSALRQNIGYVPDTCAFPLESTVEAIGKLGEKAYEDWDGQLFSRYCREMKLSGSKLVKDLSRGMSMKLSLAFALSHKPQLLILDEVTAGLDPLAREEVLELLRHYVESEECGILMSSHITSDLEKISDYLVAIHEGEILFSVATEEITDFAGIAHCSCSEVEVLLGTHSYERGSLKGRRCAYGWDVLVPNRFDFAEAFPEISVESCGIDEYLLLTVKGERL